MSTLLTTPSVVFDLTFPEIRTGTIATLTGSSTAPFSILLSGRVVAIDEGLLTKDGWLESTLSGSKHKISVRLWDWVGSRKSGHAKTSTASTVYGPRFYPFLGSTISGSIQLKQAHLSALLISIPAKYRASWHDCQIYGNEKITATLSSFGSSDSWTYSPRWQNGLPIERVQFDMPVRLSGLLLQKYAQYPFLQTVVSEFALILAAQAPESNRATAVYGTLIAASAFLVKHWGESEVPQGDTLLSHIYLFLFLLLLLSSVLLHLHPVWGSVSLVPIVAVATIGWSLVNNFSHSGELPSGIFRHWSRHIAAVRSDQMNAARMRTPAGSDE